MHKLIIDKISNGYIVSAVYDKQPLLLTYFKDMTSVVRHLGNVYTIVEAEQK